MVKIYSVFFLIFFSAAAFGQDVFKDLKNRIHRKTMYSQNREALDLINQQTQQFTDLQRAELEVLKLEILNELGLVDEAFTLSKNILAKQGLAAELEVRTHLQRALIFETGLDAKNCKNELDKAEVILQKHTELKPQNYTYFLIRKASYYRIFGDHKSAFKIASAAEKYAEKVNDQKNGAALNTILGFGSFEKPEKALHHFQKAVRLYKNYSNYSGTAAMYINISKFYIDQKNYTLAEKYIDSAIAVVPKVEISYVIGNVYSTKSKILEHQRKYLAAFQNYKIATEWNNKTHIDNKDIKVQELDILYNSEKNKLREKELEDNVSIVKNWSSILTVFSSLLVISILMLLYSLQLLSKNKKKIELQKQKIFAKNAVLKRNVQEKQFLVRELNHRVKNNLAVILSLVGFQRDETQNILYKHKFEQLHSRINTISLGHNLFSYHLNNFDNSIVEIKEYSEKIFESHKAGFSKTLLVENDLEQVLLPVDQGLSYGLLLNELITNTLKHAVPVQGQSLNITLSLKKTNNRVEMQYCDNGMFFGINDGSNSLGHFIIDAMVQQLDGTLDRKDSCYHIVFSINGENPADAEIFSTDR